MKNLFLFLIVIFLFSCKDENIDKETKVFAYYLKETFGWEIKQEPHVYILTNSVVCKGCVSRVMLQLPSILPKESDRYTIITSNASVFPQEIRQLPYFYKDSKKLLNSINLQIENVTIIHTDEGKVSKIKRISVEDVEDTEKGISHFFKIE